MITIVVSDIHISSKICLSKYVQSFLHKLLNEEIKADKLIINGDLFDNIKRLKKSHWKILSLLRKIAEKIDTLWVLGNHDGETDSIAKFLGIKTCREHIENNTLFIHGDIFDEFISKYPLLTNIADAFYVLLQMIDETHSLARFAKNNSKTFLGNAEKVANGAIELAIKKNCNTVCCGHVHKSCVLDKKGVKYFNSGSWTELPCSYIRIEGSDIKILEYNEKISN